MHPLLENYFSLIRRFLPNKSKGSAVGLDIGTGECKLIELKRTGNEFELVNIAIEQVIEGGLRATIQKIMTHTSEPCKSPITSVFGKGTLIRYIDMPRMSLTELRNSFSIEADKYFPFAQDQIYTDCYILDSQNKSNHMTVLAAAAKKELVDQRVQLLTEFGYQIDFIGVNSVALANAINVVGYEGKEDANRGVALLDIGELVSTLTIIDKKTPRFTRDIFIGGRDFTKRISNALGITFDEAEQLKINPGNRTQEVLSAFESIITNISQEIKLSFDYFTTEKNSDVAHVLLTGAGAMSDGITEIFEKHLEIRVQKWNPLKTLKTSSNIPKEKVEKIGLKYGVALGLALYHYD